MGRNIKLNILCKSYQLLYLPILKKVNRKGVNMGINSVFLSNYGVSAVKPSIAKNIAFSGKQKTDSVEIRSNKPETAPFFLKKVFDKCGLKTGAERDKAVKLPEILDLGALRTGRLSKRVAAICMRYGNADISQVKPKFLDKVKSNLVKTGINIKNDNMKLVIMSDSNKNWVVRYKIVSYYDDKTGTSIVFDEAGDPAYRLSYKYNSLGSIKGYKINIFTEKRNRNQD